MLSANFVTQSSPLVPTLTTEPSPIETNHEPSDAAAGAPASVKHDLITLVRGYCMGAADTVPGVSGGTVALVLGHYERLLTAISHFDSHSVSLLRHRQWRGLWNYLDLRFLGVLLTGILLGIGSLASTMHWLLEHRMSETLAVFFGLVFASGWIVIKMIRSWSPLNFVSLGVGAAAAYWLCGLTSVSGSDSLLYLFLSGMIAICAMILPGISGAFMLLMMGMYHPVMGMVKQFVKGDITFDIVLRLSIFALACITGLLAFSRFLKWLLKHHHDITMAALLGLMVGSLRRVWPLQVVTPETADLPFKEQVFELVSPAQWQGSLVIPAVLAIGAAVLVVVLEKVAEKIDSKSHTPHS